MKQTSEAAFETAIEAVLLDDGYSKLVSGAFDIEWAVFPDEALTFIRETQSKIGEKLEALHGAETGERVLSALTKRLDTHGALTTLRHGFKCFGKTLRVAFFRPLPRQPSGHHSPALVQRQNKKSLEVVLSVNGIPVVTLDLKNPLSGQTAANAIHQYRHDRDPREPVLLFTKRILVHFAVDTEEAHMTTRLAGTSTHFLPFNQGWDGGVGNPPDKAGRNYKTAYLWEEVVKPRQRAVRASATTIWWNTRRAGARVTPSAGWHIGSSACTTSGTSASSTAWW